MKQTPHLCVLAVIVVFGSGCATIRVTDPHRTASEQFLMSEAIRQAVEQLSADALRDRQVFIDPTYLGSSPATIHEIQFLLGELRARLLVAGVRLVSAREQATVVLEVRSGGVGIDRLEYLLGIPAIYMPGTGPAAAPVVTPELAIVKSTRQYGYASVAFVSYWRDTGEVVVSSGPFVGRTEREDWWLFGTGPRTVGNIPTTDR